MITRLKALRLVSWSITTGGDFKMGSKKIRHPENETVGERIGFNERDRAWGGIGSCLSEWFAPAWC